VRVKIVGFFGGLKRIADFGEFFYKFVPFVLQSQRIRLYWLKNVFRPHRWRWANEFLLPWSKAVVVDQSEQSRPQPAEIAAINNHKSRWRGWGQDKVEITRGESVCSGTDISRDDSSSACEPLKTLRSQNLKIRRSS